MNTAYFIILINQYHKEKNSKNQLEITFLYSSEIEKADV